MPIATVAHSEHLKLIDGRWILHAASGSSPLRVELPAGAHATILEDGAGVGCDVQMGVGAKLEWVRWQHEVSSENAAQNISLTQDSQLKWTNVQFGCEALNNPVHVRLNGVQAAAHMHGISFGQKSEQVQNQICVEHLAPHTESAQLFKSVLRDQAKSTFAGKIVIRREAQKSDARQRHQSLNFHSTAQSITRPELEVEADDVKAAHGATVGRLNEEELFYLQTRGISRDQGMGLLARAFVQEVLGTIQNPAIYSFIDKELHARIGEFLRAMEKGPQS